MDMLEVLTLLLVIFAALTYIDNRYKKQNEYLLQSQKAFAKIANTIIQ